MSLALKEYSSWKIGTTEYSSVKIGNSVVWQKASGFNGVMYDKDTITFSVGSDVYKWVSNTLDNSPYGYITSGDGGLAGVLSKTTTSDVGIGEDGELTKYGMMFSEAVLPNGTGTNKYPCFMLSKSIDLTDVNKIDIECEIYGNIAYQKYIDVYMKKDSSNSATSIANVSLESCRVSYSLTKNGSVSTVSIDTESYSGYYYFAIACVCWNADPSLIVTEVKAVLKNGESGGSSGSGGSGDSGFVEEPEET